VEFAQIFLIQINPFLQASAGAQGLGYSFLKAILSGLHLAQGKGRIWQGEADADRYDQQSPQEVKTMGPLPGFWDVHITPSMARNGICVKGK
jgi:hypothetical protein